ncbi:hypothetical protein SNEBB_010507 [Seison nebaliae]|nr:hypothetical protein SNEBB_010507 [Seison nebaliae]
MRNLCILLVIIHSITCCLNLVRKYPKLDFCRLKNTIQTWNIDDNVFHIYNHMAKSPMKSLAMNVVSSFIDPVRQEYDPDIINFVDALKYVKLNLTSENIKLHLTQEITLSALKQSIHFFTCLSKIRNSLTGTLSIRDTFHFAWHKQLKSPTTNGGIIQPTIPIIEKIINYHDDEVDRWREFDKDDINLMYSQGLHYTLDYNMGQFLERCDKNVVKFTKTFKEDIRSKLYLNYLQIYHKMNQYTCDNFPNLFKKVVCRIVNYQKKGTPAIQKKIYKTYC